MVGGCNVEEITWLSIY